MEEGEGGRRGGGGSNFKQIDNLGVYCSWFDLGIFSRGAPVLLRLEIRVTRHSTELTVYPTAKKRFPAQPQDAG